MAGEAGGFGEMLKGLFSGAVQVPVGLVKNGLEIVKDPSSSLNDKGEVSLTRLLFPEFRKEKMAERAAAAEIAKAEALTKNVQTLKSVADLFAGTGSQSEAWALSNALGGTVGQQKRGKQPGVVAPENAPFADQSQLIDQFRRTANQRLANTQQGATAAGLPLDVARIADIDSAQAAGQTAFSTQKQQETNVQQAGLTRETDRLQAGLTRESDRLRQERAFTNQTEGARYNAILDTWKAEQTKGTKADPYPVLRRLYDSKAFAGNPGMEDLVVSHLVNKTDPEAAGKLLTGFQDTVVKPTRANQTLEGRKNEAAQAEAWLAANGDLFAQGTLQRRRLASVKGPQAVKLVNRLIEQTDLTGKDASVFGQALADWRRNAPASAAPELLAKVDAALGVGGKAAEDVFGQIPVTSPKPEDIEDQSASDFVQAVLATPGLDEKTVPASMRDTLALAATAGGETAKNAAKVLFERITKVGSGEGNMAKLTGNVYGRKLLESQTAHEMALADLDAMEQFRGTKKAGIFGTGAATFAAAGRISEKLLGSEPSNFTKDRTALESLSGGFMANFIKGLSGAVVTEAEFERLSRVGPNERDSQSAFFIKRDLMAAAKQRDLERVRAQQQAFLNDDLDAFNAIAAERGRDVSTLREKLAAVPGGGTVPPTPIPPEDMKWLSPEEQQSIQP